LWNPSSLLTDGAQLIGGQWVPAAGGETIDVINPADAEVLNGFRFLGVSEPRTLGGGSDAASVASGNHDVDAR
jgi:acyl-CoA reductase-like NAD-dependent aldehyde dehydrogenase